MKAFSKLDGPLRILMVSARYLPYIGGTEIHTHEVARRLAAAGHYVTVLTTDTSGTLPPVQQSEGVCVRRVRAWPKGADYYFAPGIYKEIVQSDWDIIHCQGWHTLVAPLAMLAAWRSKTPYVVTFHSGGHSLHWRNMVRPLQRAILRPLLARADKLIGVSEWEEEFFRSNLRLPHEKFTVIPNGAHLPDVQLPTQKQNEELVILSVGRLEHYKGHHRVIEAFAKVTKYYPNARLKIVGAGPRLRSLQRLSERLGVAEQTQIGAIAGRKRELMTSTIASADLFILMSDYESQGISVMEALSLGRPTLVTDNTALSELATRGLAQAVPPSVNANDLANAIIKQLEKPLVPKSISLPTWETCYTKLVEVYADVLKKKVGLYPPQLIAVPK